MFTTNHFIWICICITFIMFLNYISQKYNFSFRQSAMVMAVVSFISELSKIFTHMIYVNGNDPSEGMVIEAEALPLHLCSMMIFVFFWLPFEKNRKLKQFLCNFIAPTGFFGAVLAIIMATSGTSFSKAEPYQCFIYHAGMLWFSLHMIKTKQVDLGRKSWITNIMCLFSLAVIMIWVNGALQVYNTNFLYVVRPPAENLPLLNLNNGWYAYFFTLVTGGFTAMTLFHLPFMIKEYKNTHSEIKVRG